MDGLYEEVRPDLLSLQTKPKKSKSSITKQFIIDQLNDNEVDLSMCDLTTVPIRELAMVPRGTRLDLSRNFLKSLPENFGSLRHLIGLDLSNNRLQSLPESIGQLALLQRLDLYCNQLRTLPLTFFNLKKLKWLDLKNNPLEPGLKEAAGSCVNSKECNQCASKVMAYLRLVLSQADREKKRQIEKQRAREKRIREEEAEKRLIIKREKERRKQLREAESRKQELEEEDDEIDERDDDTMTVGSSESSVSILGTVEQRRWTSVGSICSTVLLLSVVVMLMVVGGIMLCSNVLDPAKCQEFRVAFIMHMAHLLELLGFKVD